MGAAKPSSPRAGRIYTGERPFSDTVRTKLQQSGKLHDTKGCDTMRMTILALALVLCIGCGSGGDEVEAVDAAGVGVADAGVAAELDAGAEGDAELQAAPKEDAFRASQVPFGPPPASTNNCQCGIGCHLTLAPDGQGYYCEYVCVVCP